MTEPKFTPGPWLIQLASANASHEIRGPHKECVAYTGAWLDEHKEEQQANARLIAAAPDLYEALENLLAEQNGPPLIRDKAKWHRPSMASAISKAEAALAKARAGERRTQPAT